MTLTQSQLRLISSIGVGILVGTSLIVIIPEGVEAIANPMLNPPPASAAAAAVAAGVHALRSVPDAAALLPADMSLDAILIPRNAGRSTDLKEPLSSTSTTSKSSASEMDAAEGPATGPLKSGAGGKTAVTTPDQGHHGLGTGKASDKLPGETPPGDDSSTSEPRSLPTFFIGFALVTGFVLMFLIDRLPRHAVDKLQSAPTMRHISLDNLASSSLTGDSDEGLEEEGFLGSLAPTPRQSRGLATTVGLVIHAAADGIAMGASATTEDMKLGLIIFVAIMVHKAPAAFGLTSVLLKHGLSKRAARGHLVVFSLAAPFGALATFLLIKVLGGSDSMEGERGQWWTGMLLLFSAGTFL